MTVSIDKRLPPFEFEQVKCTSIFNEGIPVTLATAFSKAAIALGWEVKAKQLFFTVKVKEPEMVKSTRHVQATSCRFKILHMVSLDPLHRKSLPLHIPDSLLSQRHVAPVLFNQRHSAMPLLAQRESLPRQLPASGPVVLVLHAHFAPTSELANQLQRAWLLPPQRES